MPTQRPLGPSDRSDGPLRVLVIGRISTEQQSEQSIEASYRYVQDYLRRMGELEIRHLGEQASGMLADRATMREAENLIASGSVDLVIAEDLSRIYRNPRFQYAFVQDAVDRGVRVICIADNLDTADENWEVNLSTAAVRHGLFIPDTCRRVRRTATRVLSPWRHGAKGPLRLSKADRRRGRVWRVWSAGLRIARVAQCTPIIRAMRARLLDLSGRRPWPNG